jgi:hypothetical protein
LLYTNASSIDFVVVVAVVVEFPSPSSFQGIVFAVVAVVVQRVKTSSIEHIT